MLPVDAASSKLTCNSTRALLLFTFFILHSLQLREPVPIRHVIPCLKDFGVVLADWPVPRQSTQWFEAGDADEDQEEVVQTVGEAPCPVHQAPVTTVRDREEVDVAMLVHGKCHDLHQNSQRRDSRTDDEYPQAGSDDPAVVAAGVIVNLDLDEDDIRYHVHGAQQQSGRGLVPVEVAEAAGNWTSTGELGAAVERAVLPRLVQEHHGDAKDAAGSQDQDVHEIGTPVLVAARLVAFTMYLCSRSRSRSRSSRSTPYDGRFRDLARIIQDVEENEGNVTG